MSTIYELSAKYESNGDPGSVSDGNGDLGGISYGIYQLSSNAGSLSAFVNWLCNYPNPDYANYGKVLVQYEVNSDSFINEWKYLGRTDKGGFTVLQNEYAKAVYFDTAVNKLIQKHDFDVTQKSIALQAVLFSRSVQYSAGNMCELFSDAVLLANGNYATISDYDLIYNIYEYLIQDGNLAYELKNGVWHSPNDWLNGSGEVIDGLINRFKNERDDALAMLGE